MSLLRAVAWYEYQALYAKKRLTENQMDQFVIEGGRKLNGTLTVAGSRNAAIPMMAASLMGTGKTTLGNVPQVQDVATMSQLLGELGMHVSRKDTGDLELKVQNEEQFEARDALTSQLRSSICLLGPLLAKRGKAIISLPGGASFGDRPLDMHTRGLVQMGAEFRMDSGSLVGTVPNGRLQGQPMFILGSSGVPSALVTMNLMAAASLAEGHTILVGAATDPEVVDYGLMLRGMGANITGLGTSELYIMGVDKLHACHYSVMSDRIEAGTFMIAAALCGGDLKIVGAYRSHMMALIDRLSVAGVTITFEADHMIVKAGAQIDPVELSTGLYPAFPTDLQAQMMALVCFGKGMSTITEHVFPERFLHIGELNRMGAKVRREGPIAIINGVENLSGARVMASDMRGSAALVLAGLRAKGVTTIDRVYHIDRGYERIEMKLQSVGAQIRRVKEGL